MKSRKNFVRGGSALTRLLLGCVAAVGCLLVTASLRAALQMPPDPATRPAGRVVSWGYRVLPNVEPDTRFKMISANYGFILALREDGTVFGWGNNYDGQVSVPTGLSGVTAISGTLALKSDGTVATWGRISEGTNYVSASVPSGLTGVVAIAAGGYQNLALGGYQNLALKSDGRVVGWPDIEPWFPTVPSGLGAVVAISANGGTSFALKNDGTVVGWGNANFGALPVPGELSGVTAISAGSPNLALKSDGTVAAWGTIWDGTNYVSASVPNGLTGVVAIAAGPGHSLALKSDRTVVAWGKNDQGQAAVPSGLRGVVAIAAADRYSLALKDDGTVVAWGASWNGSVYDKSIVLDEWSSVVAIAAGYYHNLALKSDGTVMQWNGDLGPTDLTNVVAIAAGYGQSFALKGDGTVVGWGKIWNGSNYFNASVPTGLNGVVAIDAGLYHSIALKNDGTVVGWGQNDYGQATVQNGLGGVTAISAGGWHNLALKTDGTVVSWGAQTTVPTGLDAVVAIKAGIAHSLALKSDGTVVAWGWVWNGTAYVDAAVPTGLSGVVAIAAGEGRSVALKGDGTLITWGDDSNYYGRSTIPVGLSGVIAIATSRYHTLALHRVAPPKSLLVSVGNVRVAKPIESSISDVSFDLELNIATAAAVSLSLSLNGGVIFNPVSAASLSGDVGFGVKPGARRIIWNAPSSAFPINAYLPNVKVRVTATAGGVTANADSLRFTVDLQGTQGGLTVEGRLRDASGASVAGATVTVGGQTVTTTSSGTYRLSNVSLAAGNTLTISTGGQVAHSAPVPFVAGARQISVPEVRLPAAGTPPAKPVVTSVSPALDGFFLAGVPTPNAFTATVNWNGATPGRVDFFANNSLALTVTGAGPDYTARLDVGALFPPSFTPGANRVRVVATSAASVASDAVSYGVPVLPLPSAIARVLSYAPVSYLEGHVGIDWDIPKNPVSASVNIPRLGRFGVELGANVSLDYEFGSGDWELSVSSAEQGTKLYLGDKELTWSLAGRQEGKLSTTTGFIIGDLTLSASVGGKFEMGRYGAVDMFGPGLSTFLSDVPVLGRVVEASSLVVYAKPELSGSAVFMWQPEFDFKSFEAQGKIGLEAVYEPELTKNLKLKLYAGGELTGTIQHPGSLLKQVRVKGYAGAEAKAFIFKFGPVEYVWLDYTWPAAGQPLMPAQLLVRNGLTATGSGATITTVDRPNLAAPEQFVAHDETRRVALASGRTVTPLEAFRAMGRGPGRILPGRVRPMDLGGPGVPQVDLTLVQGVFPDGQPALAGRGLELMLLYVADNGGANALQFTDIKWTRFDGTNWTAPAFVATDTRAEFAPQVAFDGNGDALAVWERVGSTNFNTTNLTAMAAEMEIVSSRWNRASGVWSQPVALTTNAVLDHAPLLAGPLANGDLMLAWTRNPANLLMGTGAVGSAESGVVLGSRWDAAARTWTAEQTLVAGVPYRLSQSLAAASNTAVYAWTRDLDGVLTNAADQQVFTTVFTNGVWTAPAQFTTGTNGNGSVRAAVSASGGTFLVWRRGTNLVMNANFATTNTLVRADAQTAGFGDYALTFGPGGNLVAVWQEMSADGPDAFYAVFDPTSGTWSRDARLFADASLERSFAPVWDSAGNLTVAYNRVAIVKTNKTVALAGGGTLTVTNVPQSDRVDLSVVKRALIRDVAVLPGGFTVAAENFLPGAAVTLSALVRNAGDLAVSNVAVGFFSGNPSAGGVLLTNAPVAGWLPGASNALASALWVVPDGFSGRTLFAMADYTGAVTEFNETNNTQSVSISGTDLAVMVISAAAETNGAVRVIALVQNLGAPTATSSVLAIRRSGQTNAPLATAAVPALEPGRLAQVALDLPAGTQLAGNAFYSLLADETRVTGDVNTNNNTATFAVQLTLDSDSDGIPDDWELANGLNPSDPNDAARDDDGDGVTNLAEFHARTNPRDRNSYLRMLSIGGGAGGIQISWGVEANRLYTVQRSTNLRTGFTNAVERILATPPETTWLDTSATNTGPFFYRVKVE